MNEFERMKKALKENLKPCPFCGCESIVLCVLTKAGDLFKKGYAYECRDCQARGGFSLKEQIAYWAWQKRYNKTLNLTGEKHPAG